MVVDLVEPKSVVDVGCGTGVWLAIFRESGVKEILGVDHLVESEVLELSKSEFMDFDLRLPLKLGRKFDLVVSLEVAEHLPKEFAEVFVDSLVALGDVVLFSAAIPHQQGFRHINEQWPDYWARIFASKGFLPVDCLRTKIWTNDDVEPWYAQNILLYATQSVLDRHPRLREQWEGNRGRPLAIVHPKVYVLSCNARSADPRALPLRKTLAVLPALMLNAAARRLRMLKDTETVVLAHI
jgi:SAM-dependent methyltransferase